MGHVVSKQTKYPIGPAHISVDDASEAISRLHAQNRFPDHSGVGAVWIVKYCQEHGDWVEFTKEEFSNFLSECVGNRFHEIDLSRLEFDGHLVKHTDTSGYVVFSITHSFVVKCFEALPADEVFEEIPTFGDNAESPSSFKNARRH